jgi:hypothetical protein
MKACHSWHGAYVDDWSTRLRPRDYVTLKVTSSYPEKSAQLAKHTTRLAVRLYDLTLLAVQSERIFDGHVVCMRARRSRLMSTGMYVYGFERHAPVNYCRSSSQDADPEGQNFLADGLRPPQAYSSDMEKAV